MKQFISLNLANLRLDSEHDTLHYLQTVCEDEDTKVKSVTFESSSILSLDAYEVIFTQFLPKIHETLMHLSLANSNLDAKVAAYVSLLLSSQGVLNSINLSNNRFGDVGAATIASAFHDQSLHQKTSLLSLSSLNLSGNSISDTGAVALARGISAFVDQCKESKNLIPSLSSLNLDNNKLGDNAAVCISQLLRKFPVDSLHLQELSLSGNNIQEKGIITLLRAVEVCNENSLCVLKLSNNHPTTAVLHRVGDMYMQSQSNNLALQRLEINFCQQAAKKAISDDLLGYTQALEKIQKGLSSENMNLSCLCIGELQLETFQASLDPNLNVEARKMLQLAIKILDSIDIIHHWTGDINSRLNFDDDSGDVHDINTGVISTELEDPFSPHARLPSIEDISEDQQTHEKTPAHESKDDYLKRLRERSARKFSEVSADIQKLINTPGANSNYKSKSPSRIKSAQPTPDITFFADGNEHVKTVNDIGIPAESASCAQRNIHNTTSIMSQVYSQDTHSSKLHSDESFTLTANELKHIVNDAVTTALESAHKEWFSNVVSPLKTLPPPSSSSSVSLFSTGAAISNQNYQSSLGLFPSTPVGVVNDVMTVGAQTSLKSNKEGTRNTGTSVEGKEINSSELERKIKELETRIATIENDYGALDRKVIHSPSLGVEERGFRGIIKRLQDLNEIEKRMGALETAVESEHVSSIHVLDILLQQQTSPRKEPHVGKVKKEVSIIEKRLSSTSKKKKGHYYHS